MGKWYLIPYLLVPLISAKVPLISTRFSAHCQAILLYTDCDIVTECVMSTEVL